MFFVGDRIGVKARKLVDVTYEAMMRGIAVVRPGVRVGAIGDTIQRYAESHRFSVVRDFCGHGVGQVFHDAPSILHYGKPDEGPVLHEGMFFTVEPMIRMQAVTVFCGPIPGDWGASLILSSRLLTGSACGAPLHDFIGKAAARHNRPRRGLPRSRLHLTFDGKTAADRSAHSQGSAIAGPDAGGRVRE
jgi:hypothetical protein